jgi:hypothetical protein
MQQRHRTPPPPTPAQTTSNDPLPIADLLRDLGYATAAAQRQARAALEAAGLTNARKQGIAASKRGRVERALAAALVRVCGDACAALVRGDRNERRTPVVTGRAGCEICGGSNNRRAALQCVRALRKNGVRTLLVVGGSAPLQHQLADLLTQAEAQPPGRAAARITVEFVDGTKGSHTQKDAIAHMNRAQLMVIWANTPLRHAVSRHYTEETPSHLRTITVARRGIEALCAEIVRSYSLSPQRH